jgi:predicted lipopolysaccharide heptosyltransferase III
VSGTLAAGAALHEPRRILVVRPRAAGDVLLATPAVRAIRRRFPDAHVAFAVRRNMLPLVAGNPDASEIVVIDAFEDRRLPPARRWLLRAEFYWKLRRARFDWAIDLHGGPRSALVVFASGARVRVGYDTRGRGRAYTLRVPRFERGADGKTIVRAAVDVNAAMLAPLGVTVSDRALVLRVPATARERVRGHLEREGLGRERPLIVVNPAAKWATKAWPTENYARLAGALAADHGADVVLLWGPGEREVAGRVAAGAKHPRVGLAPEGDLGDAAALVEAASLVVGTDSGVSHMAAALATPSVTLFGPTNPREWHAYDPTLHVAVHHPVPCSFCNLTRCEWHACLRELSVERVFAACSALLARQRG